ncbi:MAG TPA: hypothetical protein VN969_25260 [Streptosporangiaceae bacterium]|nr:hypothetical protein [Streptosporangiaceae bacterium]
MESSLMRCNGNRFGEQRLGGLPAALCRVGWEQRETRQDCARRGLEDACHDAG